jgi:thiosulfate dehydrogenase
MIGRISKFSGLCTAAVVVAGIVSLTAGSALAEMESSFARGGKLYDKWYAVIKADKPTESHPLYPASGC